ncbi:response regulator [Streptomyces abyssalis]|uniref:Response regulator n=1 Tax=Streptomyces abyssalis TaxID=933944 RepID=A0A1E7JGV6_9ACTN|nr:response regulator [Streptomyces abyssalis]OEU92847.1 response regulator [Streptomyces abyssalis]OEV31204.1 response regulator [Streptomyces nanshensis]
MSGRVLVVDDDNVIRQLIKVNLELEGFEVVTAADGVECLDIVQGVRPDLVTLDVAMPRLDGLRTAERLRADPRTRHIPVAIVSGHTKVDGADGEEPPVDALLAKPFEPSELVAMVRQLTGRTEGREARPPGGADDADEQEPAPWPAGR